MLYPSTVPLPADAVAAVRDYLRLDGDGDSAVIGSLVLSAIAQCERFIGAVLIEREMVETLEETTDWSALSAWPVTAVTGVATAGGVPLTIGTYETDIGSTGRGRLRVTAALSQRLRVAYRAGLATAWTGLAEPVRHGIVRLVAHHYEARDRIDESGAPDVVLALWRGARRMHLS
jgi:uncharacterized phiE125 gp8 family phage protein